MGSLNEEVQKSVYQVIVFIPIATFIILLVFQPLAQAQVLLQLVCEVGAVAAEVAVVEVLYGVVGAAQEHSGNVRPSVLHL